MWLGLAALMAFPLMAPQAHANKGAAFIGGLIAGHVVSGAVQRSKVRTAAEVEQANNSQTRVVYQQAPAPAAAPAASSKGSAEQRIQELDKLATGGYITPDDIPANIIAKEKEIGAAQVEGKPAEIIDKIVMGKINKWYTQVCLTRQPWVKDDKKSFAKIAPKVTIKRFLRWQVGEDI